MAPTSAEVNYDLYAILDGATVKKLPDACEDLEATHACLFKGETDPAILVRAPWIMKLEPGEELMEWFIEEGWGRNWGVVAQVPAGTEFEEVVRHFRQFVQVKLPDQKIVFFRYFDPRVLRLFLPTCDAPQLQSLFALPALLSCESEDPDVMLVYGNKAGTLTKTNLSLPDHA